MARLKPIKSDIAEIYTRQVKDKSCSVCVNVGRGGKFCKECTESGNLKHWRNAFVLP